MANGEQSSAINTWLCCRKQLLERCQEWLPLQPTDNKYAELQRASLWCSWNSWHTADPKHLKPLARSMWSAKSTLVLGFGSRSKGIGIINYTSIELNLRKPKYESLIQFRSQQKAARIYHLALGRFCCLLLFGPVKFIQSNPRGKIFHFLGPEKLLSWAATIFGTGTAMK